MPEIKDYTRLNKSQLMHEIVLRDIKIESQENIINGQKEFIKDYKETLENERATVDKLQSLCDEQKKQLEEGLKEDFNSKLQTILANKMINELKDTRVRLFNFHGDNLKLQSEKLLADCLTIMDFKEIKKSLAESLEVKISDIIINQIGSEISKDTKKILSNQELREDLRSILRNKMKALAKTLEEPAEVFSLDDVKSVLRKE